MIYYVTIELQNQEQAVIKVVSATSHLEAEAFAYRAFFRNYDVYVSTTKPEYVEVLADDGMYLDENGEEIIEEEE